MCLESCSWFGSIKVSHSFLRDHYFEKPEKGRLGSTSFFAIGRVNIVGARYFGILSYRYFGDLGDQVITLASSRGSFLVRTLLLFWVLSKSSFRGPSPGLHRPSPAEVYVHCWWPAASLSLCFVFWGVDTMYMYNIYIYMYIHYTHRLT